MMQCNEKVTLYPEIFLSTNFGSLFSNYDYVMHLELSLFNAFYQHLPKNLQNILNLQKQILYINPTPSNYITWEFSGSYLHVQNSAIFRRFLLQ